MVDGGGFVSAPVDESSRLADGDADAADGEAVSSGRPGSGATGSVDAHVVQDAPAPSPAQRRLHFGAHLEAHYRRLVAQLYAITLDAGEAHGVVQDAYSRAWRAWDEIGVSADPTAWLRRVAVRSTMRSWRRLLPRRSSTDLGTTPRTTALLAALGRLPAAERRSVVLHHMAGTGTAEIAAIERTTIGTVKARLARAELVVVEGMADVLPEVLGLLEAEVAPVMPPLPDPIEPRAVEGTDDPQAGRSEGSGDDPAAAAAGDSAAGDEEGERP